MASDTMVKIATDIVSTLSGKNPPGTLSPLDPDFKGTFTKVSAPAGELKDIKKDK